MRQGGRYRIQGPSLLRARRSDVQTHRSRMSDPYKIELTAAQRDTFEAWSKADPVDIWELLRDRRIEAVQGNKNPFVR